MKRTMHEERFEKLQLQCSMGILTHGEEDLVSELYSLPVGLCRVTMTILLMRFYVHVWIRSAMWTEPGFRLQAKENFRFHCAIYLFTRGSRRSG